jgi:hypothetical protein
MSRLDGEDPRRDRFFQDVEPPAQPESTVDGAGYVGSEELFRDTDEWQKREAATPSRPMTGPFGLTIPPPRPSRRYVDPPQRGNAEWFAVEAEKSRFATLLLGRDPTEAEEAEHQANIKAIREGIGEFRGNGSGAAIPGRDGTAASADPTAPSETPTYF